MTNESTSDVPGANGPSAPGPARGLGPAVARRIVDVLTYVLGPIGLLGKHEIKRAGTVMALGSREFEALPVEVQRWLTETEAALAQQGFGAAVRVVSEPTTSVKSYVSLLEHGDGATLATAAATRTSRGQTIGSIFLRSQAADGTFIITSSGRVRRRFPLRPGYDAITFPKLGGPAALYALHRFRLAERAAAGRPRPITVADPVAYVARETSETHDHWQRIGYYRPGAEGTLRLTVKGAICTVWRAKFPWAQLTEWGDARARARVLARYGAAGASLS